MKAPAFVDVKNQINRAMWAWRWHMQKGSGHWTARPYPDLRNEEDLKRYRVIELKRRRTPYGRRVVTANAWKFENIRQQTFKRMALV